MKDKNFYEEMEAIIQGCMISSIISIFMVLIISIVITAMNC